MKDMFLLLCFCLFLITCNSCKTDDMGNTSSSVNQLPDAHSATELSVFGCKINGEIWTPTGFNGLTYTYHEPTGGFSLSANIERNSSGVTKDIRIVTSFFGEGTYQHIDDLPYFDFTFCEDNPEYGLDTLSNSFIKIEKFSKDEGLIIGSFEFTAINNDTTYCSNVPDTAFITEGRFKATYK